MTNAFPLKHMKKPIIIVLALLFTLTSAVSTTRRVDAVGCDESFYSQNDILFYNPCSEACSADSTTSVVVGNASGIPLTTVDYLDGLGVQAKADGPENKNRYMYAESQTGLKWQVLAALHYREAGMVENASIVDGSPLGSGQNEDGVTIVSDPNQDAVVAAELFITLAKKIYGIDPSIYGDTMTIEQWGSAFLAYDTGLLYKQRGKTYDLSPYVMNGFDEQHLGMAWLGSPFDRDEDRTAGTKDRDRAGALSVMVYLKAITVESECSPSGAVFGDIVQTALSFANDTPASDGTNQPSDAKQAYRDAMPKYNGTDATYPQITDCGRFVSTVMRASGADPEFPPVGVGKLTSYMNNSPKYQSLGTVAFADLRPGDIMAIPAHVILFTGEVNGYMAADASLTERVPSVRKVGSPLWMLDNGAEVWRLK